MQAFNFKRQLCAITLLLLSSVGASVQATTLSVNCGGNYGLTSINSALKALQSSEESHGPSTINVSGPCNENVVIQSMDRLTLNAVNGASITDASGKNSDVIQIGDSRSVSINNFTISGGDNGIECSNGSVCRLNGNTIQGANIGVVAFGSQINIFGGTLQNNGAGLLIWTGSSGEAGGVTIENNNQGISVRFQAFLHAANSTITNNGNGGGAFVANNGTFMCTGCRVTGNGSVGVLLRRDSSAFFEQGYVITGNADAGVRLSESSSAQFASPGTVTGNAGGTDVLCTASFTTVRGTTNIGGGVTNCVEPPL